MTLFMPPVLGIPTVVPFVTVMKFLPDVVILIFLFNLN